MQIVVLHVKACPNLEPLLAEIDHLVADRTDIEVKTTLVDTDADAERLNFHGSPTILVDGRDPFDPDAASVGLSCRRYETEEGPRGYPTLAQLVDALPAER